MLFKIDACVKINVSMNRKYKVLLVLAALSASMFIAGGKAQAATLEVTGGCTLAIAIDSANAGSDQAGCTATGDTYGTNDTITLADGTYTLTADLPVITTSVDVIGQSMTGTIIDGDAQTYSGLKVDGAGLSSNLSDFTIQNMLNGGLNVDNGAAVIINRVIAQGNTASAGGGLVVTNGASVTLNESILQNNTADNAGGGFSNAGGTAVISNSTIYNNTGQFGGGGVLLFSGTTTIINTTIAGNIAAQGAGITSFSDPVATIINTTIYGNTADGAAGGVTILQTSGSISFQNTIIAGNTVSDCDGDGTITPTSNGGNLSSGSSCTFLTEPTDITGTAPLVASLTPEDNGGPTPTIALLDGSPALNAGVATDAPSTDQRGQARPQGSGFDIGAYELVVAPSESVAPTDTTSAANLAGVGAPNTGLGKQASSTAKQQTLVILITTLFVALISRIRYKKFNQKY